jgi:hypothetical protein
MGYELCEFRFYEGTHGTVVSKSAVCQVLEGRHRNIFNMLVAASEQHSVADGFTRIHFSNWMLQTDFGRTGDILAENNNT